MQQWLHRMALNGVLIVLRVALFSGKPKPVLDVFENTSTYGMIEKANLCCKCAEQCGEGLNKLEEHVLMPLSSYLASKGCELPKGWDVRSKILPNLGELLGEVDEKARALERRASDKMSKLHIQMIGEMPSIEVFQKNVVEGKWNSFTRNGDCPKFIEKSPELIPQFPIDGT